MLDGKTRRHLLCVVIRATMGLLLLRACCWRELGSSFSSTCELGGKLCIVGRCLWDRLYILVPSGRIEFLPMHCLKR